MESKIVKQNKFDKANQNKRKISLESINTKTIKETMDEPDIATVAHENEHLSNI